VEIKNMRIKIENKLERNNARMESELEGVNSIVAINKSESGIQIAKLASKL
jgi:hypothetical protein